MCVYERGGGVLLYLCYVQKSEECVCGLRCHSQPTSLMQGLFLNLGVMFSQPGWKLASPSHLPVNAHLLSETIGVHRKTGFLCAYWDPNCRPQDCTAGALSHWTDSPSLFVICWGRRLDYGFGVFLLFWYKHIMSRIFFSEFFLTKY